MYASILYSMREFHIHAQLLRSWTWGLQSKFQQSTVPVKNPDPNGNLMSWPRIPSSVALIPSCPMNCETRLTPTPADNNHMKYSCSTCSWSVELPTIEGRFTNTNSLRIRCSVCRTSSRGLVAICPRCHHGGHVDHLFGWFSSKSRNGKARQCPSLNCDCLCTSLSQKSSNNCI